jgi:hypothetical protein
MILAIKVSLFCFFLVHLSLQNIFKLIYIQLLIVFYFSLRVNGGPQHHPTCFGQV